MYSPVHDADWLDGYPNRVGGSVITGTDATVAQYCSYMGEIPTEDGARSNRPAVWINVFEYSSRVCEMLERYRYSMDYVVFPGEESWAVTNVDLHFPCELRVLFWQKRAKTQ